jgi:hypothetical protein
MSMSVRSATRAARGREKGERHAKGGISSPQARPTALSSSSSSASSSDRSSSGSPCTDAQKLRLTRACGGAPTSC